jgi:hypothetical protein
MGGRQYPKAVHKRQVHFKSLAPGMRPSVAAPWYESTLLWGAGGIFVAIILTVVAAMMKDLRWLLIVAWPFFGLAAFALFQKLISRTVWRRFATIGSVLIVALLLMLLNAALTPTQSAAETPTISVPEIILESLFATDFSNLIKFTIADSIDFEDGQRVPLRSQEYANFAANSSFVGFYIPNTPLTFRTCVRISNSVPIFLGNIRSSVGASGSFDGGETNSRLSNLVFSGRVFIYHEWPLTIKQKSTLVDYFNEAHLNVQFLGIEYLRTETLSRKLKAQQAGTRVK